MTIQKRIAVLGAGPARHPSYEPAAMEPAAAELNLFRGAETRASGHWSDRTPASPVRTGRVQLECDRAGLGGAD